MKSTTHTYFQVPKILCHNPNPHSFPAENAEQRKASPPVWRKVLGTVSLTKQDGLMQYNKT